MRRAALLLLPTIFLAAALLLREQAGPFWIWHIVDPSYFYLFDSVHLANLEWAGQTYHPGTPVQILGGLVLRLFHPLVWGNDLAALVLADPEGHLRLISTVLVGLIALGLLASGWVALVVTDRLALALVMQAGPFMSMVTLKNVWHVKPESLLVAIMLAFGIFVLLALRPGALDGSRMRFAAAFGLLAGMGVATKLTSAPVFLLPLFLLGGWRWVGSYVLFSCLSLALFVLPALNGLHNLFDLAARAMTSTGPYGGGGAGFIDPTAYPSAFIDIFKRPVLHLPVLLSLIAIGVAWGRRKKGLEFPGPETRVMAGLALAIFVHVLFVAKQPTANYMVPSYMLAPLAVVMIWRFVAGLELGSDILRKRAAIAFSLLLGAGIAAQVVGTGKLDREMRDKRLAAASLDDDRLFAACSRIHVFPASSPWFALHLGDWWTGGRHGGLIAALVPEGVYWFEQNTMELRDARGPVRLADVVAARPCLFMRGGHPGPISTFIAREMPELPSKLRRKCSTADEHVWTMSADCNGRIDTAE